MMTRALCLLLFAAASCRAPDPPRAGTLERDQTLLHDGQERRFHLYEAAQEGPLPLVISLHGAGGDIDNHIGLDAARWPHQVWLDLADEEGLHVLVPQGIDKRWNDCRAECERCGDEDDIGFLLSLLDEVTQRVDVDEEHIFVMGESNGGFMAQRLAQEAPERFAGMGVVISLMPGNNDCAPRDLPMPAMYQVGTLDRFIPFEGGSTDEQIEVLSAEDTLAYWGGLNGCEDAPATTTLEDLDPRDGSTATRQDFACTAAALSMITLEGAGHVAPSVEVQVSSFWEGLAGAQNHDVEGAREFWGFFEARLSAR